ncbi:MAG TPA: hypothetical protein VIS56_02375 [Candidatus Saccharimonadales bacterium]
MAQLEKLESTLDDVFNKKVPFKIPENGRKALAGALWWLALIFGVLQLWGAWALWRVAHWADAWVDYANSLSAAYGGFGDMVGALIGSAIGVYLLFQVRGQFMRSRAAQAKV